MKCTVTTCVEVRLYPEVEVDIPDEKIAACRAKGHVLTTRLLSKKDAERVYQQQKAQVQDILGKANYKALDQRWCVDWRDTDVTVKKDQ